MKTKTIQIPVAKNRISFLSDPTGQGRDTMHAYIKMTDLPLDLPMDVNPRSQNTESRVARQIQNGLLEESDVFHLLNRGMTVTALSANYDNKSQILSLEVANGYYGLLDGGHTYAVIRKNILPYIVSEAVPAATDKDVEQESETEGRPEFLDKGYVRMEIMVGVKNGLLVDVARSRNTSAQVRDESLANLEGSFDWLKEILDKTPYGDKIAYKENEDDSLFPIDIREIVSLLTLFYPDFQESERPPIMGYTSKGRCLEMFREKSEGYKMLKPIIPDILKLYDYIHLKFADVYKEIGGFGNLDSDKPKTQKSIKLAKVVGVKSIKEGFTLDYSGETAYYRFPDGWLFPILSSLRAIVSYKNNARWKANPYKFFDATGKSLVTMTLETSISMGRNPNAVGKNKPHWVQLHAHELNQFLKLLNVDSDRDVDMK